MPDTPSAPPLRHAPPPSTRLQRQVAVAACFGTFLEWYDFLTFATLATYFGPLFFPPDNPVAGLLASLATFGAGMVVRPLGAALFGSLGDRLGRRRVFIVTIVLMGLSTVGVGLLPTHAQVGLLAPALLLALRLLQGLSVGGEIGGSAVYLTEHAPAERRGLFTSVLQLMGPLGMMASAAQLVLLQAWLPEADFAAWGWRVPFLVSALLLAVSLKSRVALHESPVFHQLQASKALSATPLRDCFRDRTTLARMGVLALCISAGGSLLFFSVQVYTTVFLKSVVKLEAKTASQLVMLATVALFPLTLAAGALSDRIGRRPVLLAGLLLGALTLQPVFQALIPAGNPAMARFLRDVPVVLAGSDCVYSPFAAPASPCARAQEWLARQGLAYTRRDRPAGAPTTLQIGAAAAVTVDAMTALAPQLQAAGWPERANPAQVDSVKLVLLLLLPIAAVALITGPQTAVLAELFPARTRYSAVALPHNLAAGWIGGLSPFVVTLLNVRYGNGTAGLWYPVALLGLAFVVGLRFLPETRQVRLEE